MTATREPSGDALLRELVAGQAQAAARFDEVFRRLGLAEGTAGEARDLAKEIVTILREQDALARVSEAKAEATMQVSALRQDLVHAMTEQRKVTDDHAERIDALEQLRTQASGAAKGARWLWDALKIVAGMGGGALLIKLLERGL